jgi:hypothetical protein
MPANTDSTTREAEFDRLAAELERTNRNYDENEFVGDETVFNRLVDERWDAEEAVLNFPSDPTDEPDFEARILDLQCSILVSRISIGLNVSEDLARLATKHSDSSLND